MLTQTLTMAVEFLRADEAALYLDDPHAKLHSPAMNTLTCVAAVGLGAASNAGQAVTPFEGLLAEVYGGGRPVEKTGEGGHVLAVPLLLGASVCGAFVVRGAVQEPWAQGLTAVLACLAASALARSIDEARASDAARRDAITGLINERFFHFRLCDELREADAERKPLALLVIDIDRFAAVNAECGFWVGSRTLREVAALLEGLAPADAIVGRIGGDEFGIILRNTHAEAAAAWSRALCGACSAAPFNSTGTARITVSAGLACFPDDLDKSGWKGDAMTALIAVADAAMRQAKTRGGNQVVRG